MVNQNTDFRLQTVLNVREHQEKSLQRDLYNIGREHEQENTVLSKLNDDMQIAVFENSTIVRARATELQTSKAFIDVLSTKIDSQEQKLSGIKNREENTRGELVTKQQSKHMLETLKKNYVEKTRKEQDSKLQRDIDEIGIRNRRVIGE